MGCSWFDRLTTSVGTDIGAQQTRLLPNHAFSAFSAVPVLREGKEDLFEIVTGDGRAGARRRQRRKLMDPAFPARTAAAQQHEPIADAGGVSDLMNRQEHRPAR